MYMFNGLYTNPAYAGSKGGPYVSGIYRHQWVGIPGAPRSTSIGFHTPFKKDQNAMGVLLRQDKLGLTDIYGADISYAYRIKIKNDLRLALGLQAGVNYYNNRLGDASLTDVNVDEVFSVSKRLTLPNFGAGLYLSNSRFYVGASAPHLLNLSLTKKFWNAAGKDNLVAKQYNHYFATAGVVIGKGDKVKFKPSVLMKFSQNAPIDFDINASVLLVERVWLGASYRIGGDLYNTTGKRVVARGESIIGIAKFLATKRLEIGYAYDFTLSNLQGYNTGTHEVMLGYDFGKKNTQRFVTPRYVNYF